MYYVNRPSDLGGPVTIDSVDPDSVVVVGVDWSEWLSCLGLTSLDESTWHPLSGAAVGNGVVQVTRKGKSVTPPAPSVVAGQIVPSISGLALASIYIDSASVGDVVVLSNHIRAGQVLDDVSVRFVVEER